MYKQYQTLPRGQPHTGTTGVLCEQHTSSVQAVSDSATRAQTRVAGRLCKQYKKYEYKQYDTSILQAVRSPHQALPRVRRPWKTHHLADSRGAVELVLCVHRFQRQAQARHDLAHHSRRQPRATAAPVLPRSLLLLLTATSTVVQTATGYSHTKGIFVQNT